MWMLVQIVLSLAVLLQGGAVAPPASPPSNAKVWIGHYDEYERYLLTAPIERYETTKVGVTRPKHAFFAPGGLAQGATVKNLPPRQQRGFFESYKSEIAAYKLDRLLELDMVPPTIEREVDGDLVSVQLWVEGTKTIKEVQQQKLRASNTEAWNREIYRQRVFDNLVANIDSNAGNLLIDRDWHIIKIDHSRCFATSKMPFPMTRIDRPFYAHLQALDEATVTSDLGDLLERGGVTSLMQRRDDIVKTFQKLIDKQGEAKVLIP